MAKTKDEYNYNYAYHYKSYRPPLHEILLDRILKDQKFKTVLDIGCGTGSSSIALTKYCKPVTGYDPSQSMIQKSQKHVKITYTNELNQLKEDYNLIVFFGSLFYINDKSFILYQNKLLKEGYLLCCDFQISYTTILSKLKVSLGEIEYDHFKNLESYNTNSFELVNSEKFETEFSCQIVEVTHLILTEIQIIEKLNAKYKSSNIFQYLINDLEAHYSKNKIKLKANMFYSYYKKISN